MIQAFKDPLLNTSSVNIIFVDQRGREEEGSGVGVTRELLTSFWEEIWKSTSLGCEEKVPSIRHDLQKAEWEAIGKFLVFGTDYGYFPTELSVVFLIACLFGEDYITTERLLKSFENYLAKDDKDFMSYCLSEDFSEDAEEYEDVLDFLGSYKCYKRPNKENIKSIIEELAHQELVQRPKYVISCWEDVLVVLKNSLHFSTIKGIERFFDKLEPTTKKVVKLFKVPQTMNDAERMLLLPYKVRENIREERGKEIPDVGNWSECYLCGKDRCHVQYTRWVWENTGFPHMWPSTGTSVDLPTSWRPFWRNWKHYETWLLLWFCINLKLQSIIMKISITSFMVVILSLCIQDHWHFENVALKWLLLFAVTTVMFILALSLSKSYQCFSS